MIESQANSNNGDEAEPRLMSMTFDEIAAILRSGDSGQLNEIIKEGRVNDINICDYVHDYSLLMVACMSGYVECARVLLDYDADITYKTSVSTYRHCVGYT